MNSIQAIKLTHYITNYKASGVAAARSIAELNNTLGGALTYQAYARKDPDGIIDEDLLALMSYSLDQLLAQYDEVDAKRADLLAVRSGDMTVDELIAKYQIDLTTFSNELI